MYAYRPRAGIKSGGRSPQRYFSSFDRVIVMLGVAATLGFVADGIATHGASFVDSFQHLFGIAH